MIVMTLLTPAPDPASLTGAGVRLPPLHICTTPALPWYRSTGFFAVVVVVIFVAPQRCVSFRHSMEFFRKDRYGTASGSFAVSSTAMVTPLKDQNTLDYAGIERPDRAPDRRRRSTAFSPLGTTGEAPAPAGGTTPRGGGADPASRWQAGVPVVIGVHGYVAGRGR